MQNWKHKCVNIFACSGPFLFFEKDLSKDTDVFTPCWEFGQQGCWSSRATTSFGLVSWAWPGASGSALDAPKWIKTMPTTDVSRDEGVKTVLWCENRAL